MTSDHGRGEQARQDAWTVRVAYDGAVQIDASAPTDAGAARLEFADGSFVEVDPLDPTRLLAVLAMPGSTGQWLLRAVTDSELADATIAGALPAVGTAEPATPTERLEAVGRAALASHLAAHDRSERTAVWVCEILSILVPVQRIGDDVLGHLPIDLDPSDLVVDLGAWVDSTAASGATAGEASELVDAASRLDALDALVRQALRSAAVALAARVSTVDEAIAEMERGLEDGPQPRGQPPDLSALLESVRAARTPTAPDGHPGSTIEVAIDHSRVPPSLDLDLDTQILIRVTGTTYRIELAGARVVDDAELFVRVFDPADNQDPTHAVVKHLARLNVHTGFDLLWAEVTLSPQDFPARGRLFADIVDGRDVRAPVTGEAESWAALTRSDLARLMLMQAEPDRFGPDARQSVVDLVARRIGPARLGELAIAAEQVRLAFVTPRVAPSSPRG